MGKLITLYLIFNFMKQVILSLCSPKGSVKLESMSVRIYLNCVYMRIKTSLLQHNTESCV